MGIFKFFHSWMTQSLFSFMRAHCVHSMLTTCRGAHTPPPHAPRTAGATRTFILSSALRMWSAIFKFLFSGKSNICKSHKAVSAGPRGQPVWWCSRHTLPPSEAGHERSDYCHCNRGATEKQPEMAGSVPLGEMPILG